MSILLAVAALFGGTHGLPCTYSGQRDIVTVEDCGWIDASGRPHLRPGQRARLRYDRNWLSAVHLDQWYAVRRDGLMAPVMAFDNWAEGFADGLARSPRGAKIGFVNRRLKLVIPARYDGAYRFEGGRAAVCIGCHLVSEGEHSSYSGGIWTCITVDGREIAHATEASGPDICRVSRGRR
jgi:WG containing repeat